MNREASDFKETIKELEKDKETLERKVAEMEVSVKEAKQANKANDKNVAAQAAADTKLQISRI